LHPITAHHGRTAHEEPAKITGALLYAGTGYPYAIAGPADALVHGALVRPRDADYDEVRAVLDRLEGYAPGAPDNLYERVATDADRADGRTVRTAGPYGPGSTWRPSRSPPACGPPVPPSRAATG
jgi:gamma-glutamylcyclotransferase (GGCT)/AIG2-like uncharacterized protein YtfP